MSTLYKFTINRWVFSKFGPGFEYNVIDLHGVERHFVGSNPYERAYCYELSDRNVVFHHHLPNFRWTAGRSSVILPRNSRGNSHSSLEYDARKPARGIFLRGEKWARIVVCLLWLEWFKSMSIGGESLPWQLVRPRIPPRGTQARSSLADRKHYRFEAFLLPYIMLLNPTRQGLSFLYLLVALQKPWRVLMVQAATTITTHVLFSWMRKSQTT